ncbi:MAG: DUF3276 family protein [Candidatus Pacebacteria bacterium]|nr:DUF3276 family protein [Candidatus Paceibacterota bacterium]
MEPTKQEKVHSQMLRAGNKNYFFDVKKASNGSNYLTIAESYKKKDGTNTINRIMIFKDHLIDFQKTLEEVQRYL